MLTSTHQVDDDFMIALKLQQQEDEAYVSSMQAGQDKFDKVTVSYAKHTVVAPEEDWMYDDECGSESDAEEESYWADETEGIDNVTITTILYIHCTFTTVSSHRSVVTRVCTRLQSRNTTRAYVVSTIQKFLRAAITLNVPPGTWLSQGCR